MGGLIGILTLYTKIFLPFDEACLVLQFIEKLNRFLIAAVHALPDLSDGEDDIDPVLIIQPAVFV